MASWKLKHITYESPQEEKDQVKDMWEGLYIWATHSRLEKPWGKETYGFVGAFDKDRCVGTTSYTISSRGQGIVSQVQTHNDYRRQGIANATVQEVIETFRRKGARVVYLAAWDEWIRNIYRKFGFELKGTMGRRGAFKLTLNKSGEDENLFRPGQKTLLRPLALDDQADLTSLFVAQHGCVVKHYELGCYVGSYFEGEFFILHNQVVPGVVPEERKVKKGYRAVVLDGDETILGLGTVIPPARRHEGHTGVVDIVIHPNYREHMAEMLDRLEENCELDHLTVYIEEHEDFKREIYECAGYRKLARLEKQLKIDDSVYNLEMYRKMFSS